MNKRREAKRNTTKKVSQKELARKFRHEAYLRAKEFRRTDPRQIALKEQQKEFQREAYQEAKKRNKAYRAGIKKAGDERAGKKKPCLLYTSDAADDLLCVDLGGRR